jgi:hypothetical protein
VLPGRKHEGDRERLIVEGDSDVKDGQVEAFTDMD